VDAYPAEEHYGLVHVFLGDLPAAERPPMMPIPEYGQMGWHASIDEYTNPGDYRRSVENGLDPAHNEFVHTTHGFSGTEGDSRVPDLKIEERAWGCGFITTYYSPPLADEKMKAASGREVDAVVTAGTFHHGPSCMTTYINPGPGYAINQNVFKTPIDATTVRTFLVQTRSFLLGAQHDARFSERNLFVREQDQAVLLALQPFFTPETNSHEMLMPSDRAVARYREFLQQWEARSWRIDEERLAHDGERVARAIPSPARREESRGWVLDPVPVLPARREGTNESRVSTG
jgi:phenylpropionate dioxygenase-like ring-hydroxylating dioxygenase large terminal subunit